MRLRDYCWVLCGLIFSGHSLASDYSWGTSTSAQQYSSVALACSAQWAGSVGTYYKNQGYQESGYAITSTTQASCQMVQPPSTNKAVYVTLVRSGSGCSSGEYNAQTGACEAPQNVCQDKQGQEMNWSKSGTSGDGFGMTREINGKPMFFPGLRACFSGCAVETTRRDCVARVSGNYFCSGTGRYTGDECPSDVPTGSDLVPEDTVETPEPQNFKDEQPCIYATDGSKEVCTSSKTDEVEGQICATLEDGSEFCTTKLPEKNGIDIRTEVTKETLADGSVKTTKKDIATVTNCVGVNNCTTTKAETTKTTTEDANGNKTGESSICKGEACPGKGNPDSDGDGVGDCTGDDCGAGGGGEGQDWYTPTGDTFGSVLTEFVGKVQQTPIASQTTSFLTFRSSGSCPRWSVSVWVFDIDIDQLCNGDIPWNAIKAVILAAAGFFAFRIALL